MSHSASFSHYRAALTTPGAVVPAVASLLARLPIAMVGLALLFFVQQATGSFAIAGLVSAGALIGVAIGSVVQGRVVDRFGPTRPLIVLSGVFALFVTVVVIAVEAAAPAPVLIALALLVGLTEPVVGSSSRALWGRLTPAGPVRNAAYTYEAISMEIFFILGPGVAGLLSLTGWWTGTGVVVAAAMMVAGAVAFALTPAVRAWGPAQHRNQLGLLGALSTPGMKTVALAALGFGVTVGFVEVAVPAVATAAGKAAMGGVLLSVLSISSVATGVVYGVRPWPRAMHLRLPVLLLAFSLLIPLAAVPTSLLWLGGALLVIGTLITPQATTTSMMIDVVAPRGTAAEAFGWVITAVTLGLAAGQSASGAIVEYVGAPVAFLTAAAAGVGIAGIVWLRRDTLRPGGDTAPASVVPAPASTSASASLATCSP